METRCSVFCNEHGGLEGDIHALSATRKILLIDTGTLDEFGHSPGDLHEQITLDFPGLQELPEGTLLKVGDVRLRLLSRCAPCEYMARKVFPQDPHLWLERIRDRRGVFAQALSAGLINVGDEVVVLAEDYVSDA